MPTCPGCECSVPYEGLELHERYCEGIRGGGSRLASSIERLDRRLQQIEDAIAAESEQGWEQLAQDESPVPPSKERRK